MAGKGNPKTGGRKKGVTNKVTAQLKDMILTALDNKGGIQYLEEQAEKNPNAFLTLVGKVLPMTVQGPDEDGAHVFRVVGDWQNSAAAKR